MSEGRPLRPSMVGSSLRPCAHLGIREERAAAHHLLPEKRDAVLRVERRQQPHHGLVAAAGEALVRRDRLQQRLPLLHRKLAEEIVQQLEARLLVLRRKRVAAVQLQHPQKGPAARRSRERVERIVQPPAPACA